MTRLSDETIAGLADFEAPAAIDKTTPVYGLFLMLHDMAAEIRQSRAAALTTFDRMVVEVWRDRLVTDDTVDRTFIAVLDRLLATKGEP